MSVREWLYGRRPIDDALGGVRALNEFLVAFEAHGQVARLKGEQAAMRRILLRMEAIRATSFVSAGYVLADVMAAVLVAGLPLSEVGPPGEAAFLVGVTTFVLRFMAALVRDLDNPYQ